MPDHYSVHLTFSWCHSQTTWCNNFLPNWPRTVLPSNPCGSRRHPEHADSDTLLSVWVPSCHSARETPDGHFSVLHSLDLFHAYLNNLLVASSSSNEPNSHLQSVIQHLAKPGTFVNIDLYLASTSLPFLAISSRLGVSSIKPHPDRVMAVEKFPSLNTKCQLCESLCLVNYYHHFVPWHWAILHPLHFLLLIHRSAAIELPWTKHARAAFQGSRDTLVTPWIP